jgi:tetratricopeptide (TPR) repeat protein
MQCFIFFSKRFPGSSRFVHCGALILGLCTVLFFQSCVSAPPAPTDFDSLLSQGKKFYERGEGRGDFLSARDYLEKAFQQFPENPEVNYYLAFTYDRLSAPTARRIPDSKLHLTRKASDFLKRYIQLAPEYHGEFLNLDPYFSQIHFWGALHLAYELKGQQDSSLFALKEAQIQDGLSEDFLEFIQNQINQCDTAAILMTDNAETLYGIHYLQRIRNIRPDITPVLWTWLSMDWYNSYLTRIEDLNWQHIPPSEESFLAQQFESDGFVRVMARADSGLQRMDIPVDNERFLTSTMGLRGLQLIQQIGGKRPVYFTAPVTTRFDIGNAFLKNRGLVYFLDLLQEESLVETGRLWETNTLALELSHLDSDKALKSTASRTYLKLYAQNLLLLSESMQSQNMPEIASSLESEVRKHFAFMGEDFFKLMHEKQLAQKVQSLLSSQRKKGSGNSGEKDLVHRIMDVLKKQRSLRIDE